MQGDDYMIFNGTNGLSGTIAYGLLRDTYNNFWVSTYMGGLSRLNQMDIISDCNTPRFLCCALKIRKDTKGDQWYFLNGAGIVKESANGYESITNETQKPLPRVMHFTDGIFNSDGTAWFSTYSYGIARYDKNNITFYYYSDKAEDRVLFDAAMARNDVPWFSTSNYGLIYVQNNIFYHVTTANGLLTDDAAQLCVDAQGALLCLSTKGVQKISGDTIYDLYLNNKPFRFNTSSYHTSGNGDYIIATSDHGLLLMRENTLYKLDSTNYLDGYSVNNILEDKAGMLWITNGQGIIQGKIQGLKMSVLHTYSIYNSLMFSKLNGIGYIDAEGIPHWSADNGFLKYKAEFENPGAPVPYFKYLSAAINGRDTGFRHLLSMFSKDELKIAYSIICWGYENMVVQRYRLINTSINDTMDYSGEEKGVIKLHNLPSGNYKVLLTATLGQNKYYSDELNIEVKPYWYNTKWFYAVAFVVLRFVIFLVVRFRTFRLQKSKQELETVVANRTAELMSSLAERNVLLKEIHHRVKNNLQVISGLLELQKEEMTDEKLKAAFSEGQSRVRSVALIHHNLYQHDSLASVDFKLFVADLVKQLREVFEEKNRKITVEVTGDDEHLDIDTAVPLGLIINELLTNAYKYAINVEGVASVILDLKRNSTTGYILIYKDNGPGIKGVINFDNATSLGLRLIKGLIGQLGGTVTYHFSNGSIFTFIFKDSEARRKD